MMRFLFILLLTGIVSGFALTIMPWWIPMPIAFCLVLLLPLRGGKAFLATGLGAALCYTLLCLIADSANGHILSRKMAVLFIQSPSPAFMIAVTALAGFLTAGLGGWTAASLRRLFHNSKLKKEEFVGEQEAA